MHTFAMIKFLLKVTTKIEKERSLLFMLGFCLTLDGLKICSEYGSYL